MCLIFLILALVLPKSSDSFMKSVKVNKLTEFGYKILLSPKLKKMRSTIVLNDTKNHSVKLLWLWIH